MTSDVENILDRPSLISRRALLTAAGVGGAALAAGPVLGSGTASADPIPDQIGDPETTPRVAGLHLQFGADASREVVVSWHTLQPVNTPQVLVTRLGRPTVDRFRAQTVSYTDAKSGVVVYAHHARVGGLRADTEYTYAALHDGADPEMGSFRTGPRGRAAFTFTSFGDQGTPTVGKVYTPPAGVTLASPPFVNDNLGSPAAGDTTAGVERVQPLFHLFNGDLCYANLANDRVRTWSRLLGEQQPQRPQPAVDARRRQPRDRAGQRPAGLRRVPDLLLGAADAERANA